MKEYRVARLRLALEAVAQFVGIIAISASMLLYAVLFC